MTSPIPSIGAPSTPVVGPRMTVAACAPNRDNLSTAHGKQPLCKECGRGFYSCLCGAFAHDDDQMPASDVVRLMGYLSPGWSRVEL